MKNNIKTDEKILGSLTKLTVKDASKVVGGARKAKEKTVKANG